ncbi:hypothetical protein K4K58_001705 [Colletotrichum sp. SAR11_239]|nr:hypothetical protein K4K58_001705 [Colletotrichum sp. SAR11_239]
MSDEQVTASLLGSNEEDLLTSLSEEASQAGNCMLGHARAMTEFEKSMSVPERDHEKVSQWARSLHDWNDVVNKIGRRFMHPEVEPLLEEKDADGNLLCSKPMAFLRKADSITQAKLSSPDEAANFISLIRTIPSTSDTQGKERVKGLEENVQSLEAELQIRTQQIEGKENENKLLNEKIKKLEKKLEKKESKRNKRRSRDKELQSLEAKVCEMSQQLEEKRDENKLLEEEIQSMESTKTSEEVGKLKGRIQWLEKSVATLHGVLDAYSAQSVEFVHPHIKLLATPEPGWSAVFCNDSLIYLPSPTATALIYMLHNFLVDSNVKCIQLNSLLSMADLRKLRQQVTVIKYVLDDNQDRTTMTPEQRVTFEDSRNKWIVDGKFNKQRGETSVVEIGACVKILRQHIKVSEDEGLEDPFFPIIIADYDDNILKMQAETEFSECVELMGLKDIAFPPDPTKRKSPPTNPPPRKSKRPSFI